MLVETVVGMSMSMVPVFVVLGVLAVQMWRDPTQNTRGARWGVAMGLLGTLIGLTCGIAGMLATVQ
ncbi:MAG: hypothetical protein ACJAZO_004549 [Myxococcota bacterium]|jgi:hypothetical protein